MVSVAIGNRSELSSCLLDSMYVFRHEVFVRRLGWSLPLLGGMERDQYDHERAVYVVARNAQEQVTACARLVPTTRAYMLPDLFPQLLGGSIAPCDETIWELSRFAADVRSTHQGKILTLSEPTLELLDTVFTHARQHGIERLVLVTSIAIERLLLRAGIDAHRIAVPGRVDGALCVALFLEINQPKERFVDPKLSLN